MQSVQLDSIHSAPARALRRIQARGKFLYDGDEKLFVRGVTYGTFRPDEDGYEFPPPGRVAQDFALMAEHGINAVRTYTVPPRWLLDLAQSHGLRLMVGLAMERYVGYLTDKSGAPDLADLVRRGIQDCVQHPAVLCYALANEIPAPTVRWLGAERTERFLQCLYEVAKNEDPQALVTYVNYPSTEYLRLPFLDLVAFNVYLETEPLLARYLARLQNLAADRPLIMSEIGLDSQRNGEDRQAEVLDWQLRTVFTGACAGAFVYAWTDEWHRGGEDVPDWDFGLTRRDRAPKPALAAVTHAFAQSPPGPRSVWPRISVVVCTYNGARTLAECLDYVQRLNYPNYEVLVIDDGSTDGSSTIAAQRDVRLISTTNQGLSHARNVGWRNATGEIVAYLDDDAFPDPDWLRYLADSFLSNSHAAVGGPNIVPYRAGFLEECVSHSPGCPVHVLVGDQEAEHIPGCNMAVRRECLEALDGFDSQFRVAGDDVDLCWRIQERGWTIGFNPGAMVWHHRRKTVRAYWKQQVGYGRAEGLLECKWPEKYNCAGHPTFAGRIYDKAITSLLSHAGRIYHGVWGLAPFQSLYERTPGPVLSLLRMPEWYLVLGFLFLLTALSAVWKPFWVAAPMLAFASGLTLIQVLISTRHAWLWQSSGSLRFRFGRRSVIIFLHLLQPLARLTGRLKHGLTFWRRRGAPGFAMPTSSSHAVFSRYGQPPERRLETVRQQLRSDRALVLCGGEFDPWDLEVVAGLFGGARLLMAVEEQGGGSQYIRFRLWANLRPVAKLMIPSFGILMLLPALDGLWGLAAVFGALTGLAGAAAFHQCGSAKAALLRVLEVAKPTAVGSGPRPSRDWVANAPSTPPPQLVPVPACLELRTSSGLDLNNRTPNAR